MADFDFLAGHAEATPDKAAVILGERSVSFAELNRRANRVAAAFAALGCRPEDRVAVMSYNSIEGFETSSGLRRAGIVIVPVNYRLRGHEIAHVVNDSGAKVVVSGPHFVEAVAEAQAEISRASALRRRRATRARRMGVLRGIAARPRRTGPSPARGAAPSVRR